MQGKKNYHIQDKHKSNDQVASARFRNAGGKKKKKKTKFLG